MKLILSSLACAALIHLPCAAAAELGATAPLVQVSQWIGGAPPDAAPSKGQGIRVVMFWDGSCGACLASVPTLNELQQKLRTRGVSFLAVTDESTEEIHNFIQRAGGKVEFTIAKDEDRRTYTAFMGASDKSSLPHAFVIDSQNRLMWHGHPLAGMDKALDEVLNGKFDIERARRVINADRLQNDYFAAAAATEPDVRAKAVKLAETILADGGSNPWLMNNFAWKVLLDPRIKDRDLGLALRAAKKAIDASAGTDPGVLDTYAKALFENGKVAEAIDAQTKAIRLVQDPARRSAYEQKLIHYRTRRSN